MFLLRKRRSFERLAGELMMRCCDRVVMMTFFILHGLLSCFVGPGFVLALLAFCFLFWVR